MNSGSFNPCFGGNQKSNLLGYQQEGDITILSFNPCFGGNQKSNKKNQHFRIDTSICFNPCFGGNQKSNDYSRVESSCYFRMFQSLFWWKSEIKSATMTSIKSRTLVSILVLVEIRNQMAMIEANGEEITKVSILVLVEIRNQIDRPFSFSCISIPCFNPCFGGNQKSNNFAAKGNFVAEGFQSLFWWKSEIK